MSDTERSPCSLRPDAAIVRINDRGAIRNESVHELQPLAPVRLAAA